MIASYCRGLGRFALACFILVYIIISTFGCGTYGTNCGSPSPDSDILSPGCNPRLLYNLSSANKPAAGIIDNQSYTRSQWPISRPSQGYISAGEINDYQEYTYDEQYIRSDHTPRVRFYRRFEGYRTGQTYR